METVCILGLGYIGLPTAALTSSKGLRVIGVDINPDIVQQLSNGRVHFEEPDLDGLVVRGVSEGRLTAEMAPCQADIYVIAVPTPVTEDKKADLSFVVNATESIVGCITPGCLVILESTVPPGTTEDVVRPILEKSGMTAGKDFFLAFCPERVLPGRIVMELVSNDRVIGGLDRTSAEKAAQYYRKFVRGELYLTDLKTAETVKLVENSFRDVNIAFANEISLIADNLGIDAWEVIGLANRHPRVSILNPGPGVGGHCIAVDPWFLVEKVPQAASLISAARKRNDSMPEHIVARIRGLVGPGSKIACLGAAYKADVGDTRESPAIEIIERLIDEGYEVYVVDPHVNRLPDIPVSTLDEALDKAECVALLVDHSEFKSIDVGLLRERFGGKLLDTRGMWKGKLG